MKTRASKRKSSAANVSDVEDQNSMKKQRVVLGEISNSNNVSVSPISNPEVSGRVRNSRIKRVAATRKALSSVDSNIDTENKAPESFTEKSITEVKFSDPQNCEPFVHEIDSYLCSMEREIKRRPIFNYIERVQCEVTTQMRGILVDWMVEVAEEYKLLPDTLFLSVSYVDRFLSLNRVPKLKLQLLGVSSMLIAAKYEEMTPPHVENFVLITDSTYNKSEVVKMEADILKSLRFEIGNPTAKTFVRRFAGIGCENNKAKKLKFECLCNYLVELSLLEYCCLKFLPSLVAASATFLARYITWPKLHPWTTTLCKFTGYNAADLKECVLVLHELFMARKGGSFPAIREKYKQHKFKNVAYLPSPPQLPRSLFEDE
ncbi:hypothetical protein Lal_00004796 [Lupinus albus]|uniref:B-like cyclin n=1 Tax=Lupinus albus TaxID=3870 RepID=A0A6A4N2Q7_LUPAL|nr:putative cyclin [Lupinus albus]KAF1865422.1 hypothetical protein Lal_00004796 [Lupinus albus]